MKQRICDYCGGVLIPKTYRNGSKETEKQFGRRRFCGTDCSKPYYLEKANQYWFSKDGLTGYGTVLTGEIFMFDKEDYEKIRTTKWYRHNKGNEHGYYIGTCEGLSIHRYILNVPIGSEVDHINLNPLDNRKANLRICTHRQNQCNQPLQCNNTSGVSGVCWQKRRRTWNAGIKYYGQAIHLGAYKTFEEAVQARNEGMRLMYGEYGFCNIEAYASPSIREYVHKKCSRFVAGAAALVLKP